MGDLGGDPGERALRSALEQGDLATVERVFMDQERAAAAEGDHFGRVVTQVNLAVACLNDGRVEAAVEWIDLAGATLAEHATDEEQWQGVVLAQLRVRAQVGFAAGDVGDSVAKLLALASDEPGLAVFETLVGVALSAAKANQTAGAAVILDRVDGVEPAIPAELRFELAAAHEKVAHSLYYQEDDFERALTHATRAVALHPDFPLANTLVCLANLKLSRFAEAEAVARALLDRDPEARHRWGFLARALLGQERYAESAEAYEQLLTDNPDSPLIDWLNLANAYALGGRPDEAVRALRRAIADAEQRDRASIPGAATVDGRAARAAESEHEFWRTLPAREISVVARRELAELLADQGAFDEALAELAAAVDPDDLEVAAIAWTAMADLHRRRGAPEEARVLLDEAVAAHGDSAYLHRLRAELLLDLGMTAEAAVDLEACLELDERDGEVLPLLDRLAEACPDDPQAHLLQGWGHLAAVSADTARRSLRIAVDGGAGGWRAKAWLARALVMEDDPETFMREFHITPSAVVEAAGLLGDAAVESGGAPEVERFLLWLIDRALADGAFLELLTLAHVLARAPTEDGAEPDPDDRTGLRSVMKALPGLGRVLETLHAAFDANNGQNWPEALVEVRSLQEQYIALGLPVSAARTAGFACDVALRLFDLDTATAQLELAKQVPQLSLQPIHSEVMEQIHPLDRPRMALFELEYWPLQAMGIGDLISYVTMLEPVVRFRSGDTAGGLAAIPPLDELVDGDELASGVPVKALISFAQIARRAGDLERAQALIDAAEPHVGDAGPARWMWLATASTLATYRDDHDAALAMLDELADLTSTANETSRRQLLGMRAQALINAGRAEEALATLPPEEVASMPTWEQPFAYSGVVFAALVAGDRAVALDAAVELVGLLESDWHATRAEGVRETWVGGRTQMYDIAVQAAVIAGQDALAFEWAEASRARDFLDDVAVGTQAERLADLSGQLRARRDDISLLDALLAEGAGPPATADLARVTEIATASGLGDVAWVFSEDAGGPMPSPDWVKSLRAAVGREADGVEAEVRSTRTDILDQAGARPVTWAELQEVLRGVG